MRAAAAIAAVAAGAALTPAAEAVVGTLPSPTAQVRGTPPLRAPTLVAAALEQRYPQSLTARQRVRVVVDSHGRPSRVRAVDRLLVRGTGDYSFAVPAPVEDVVAARGSESEPGLRSGAILWQGFSARSRVLAAVATLRVRPAAAALPVRLIVRRDDGTELRLQNATRTVTTALVGHTPAREIANQLDLAYLAASNRPRFAPGYLQVNGATGSAKVAVVLPLSVSGTYRLGDGSARRFQAALGGHPLRLSGSGALTALDLVVRVPTPAAVLRPPRGRSWRGFAATGGLGRNPTAFAVQRLLQAALARQFHSFLTNPDPHGASQTQYRFVLGAGAVPADEPASSGGRPWLPITFALLGAAAALGLLVAWAHA